MPDQRALDDRGGGAHQARDGQGLVRCVCCVAFDVRMCESDGCVMASVSSPTTQTTTHNPPKKDEERRGLAAGVGLEGVHVVPRRVPGHVGGLAGLPPAPAVPRASLLFFWGRRGFMCVWCGVVVDGPIDRPMRLPWVGSRTNHQHKTPPRTTTTAERVRGLAPVPAL